MDQTGPAEWDNIFLQLYEYRASPARYWRARDWRACARKTCFENRRGESDHSFVIFVHIFACRKKDWAEHACIWQFRVNSSPDWRDESNYMRIFSPAKRAGPVANAGTPEKRAGPPNRANSCNRKVENTYKLYSKRASPVSRGSASM